jgi:redox-sensing transcriptional repressor
VAQYPTFSREGFRTIALFDTLETKVGRCLGEIPVLHMDRLEEFVSENVVDIAVLALPKRNAQEALTRLYQVGVRAIWNFAPTDLNHPEDMLVVNVHLSDSLQQLSYRMAHRND